MSVSNTHALFTLYSVEIETLQNLRKERNIVWNLLPLKF